MQDKNLTEGLEISSALSSGSYRKVKYKRMRVYIEVRNVDCAQPPLYYACIVYVRMECMARKLLRGDDPTT